MKLKDLLRHPFTRLSVVILVGACLFGASGYWILSGVALVQDRTALSASMLLPTVPAEPPALPVEPTRPAPEDEPEAPVEDWMVRLVNAWNPLPADFPVELAEVERSGGKVWELDARAVKPLQDMLFDCRAAGHDPMICSAYRTNDYQTGLFERQVRKQQRLGLDGEAAVAAAATVVALPGTSEHQTGLAVDLCTFANQNLDESQEQTGAFGWLREHCAEYGFILRYPPGTTEITGIIYEPWHFRYVGTTAARAITEAGITLEEYQPG